MALFEDQARRNFEMFERSMNMFTAGSPSAQKTPEPSKADKPKPKKPAEKPAAGAQDQTLEALQKQMAEMQAQLAALSKPSK